MAGYGQKMGMGGNFMPILVGPDPVTGANWHNCDDPWGCYLQVCSVMSACSFIAYKLAYLKGALTSTLYRPCV